MFLHREWLEQTDTEDQQQHIVQGFTVDPELVAKAIAGENGVKTFDTINYQEVRDFLGFDLPQNIFLQDWEPEHYFISIQPMYIKVVIVYSQKDDQQSQLILDLRLFTNIEDAYVPYEQERNGMTEIIGNIAVYFSNNYDNNTAVWITSNCTYWLHSKTGENILKDCVKQLIGGNNE